ncbi:MAG: hypothetical protein VX880_02515 [Bacteroidota bacterium]|nr:hypothetical protein [Bacteroidota bacterium]
MNEHDTGRWGHSIRDAQIEVKRSRLAPCEEVGFELEFRLGN